MKVDLVWFVATVPLFVTLLTISVIDARHLRIPDSLSLPLLAAGLFLSWSAPDILQRHTTVPDHLIGALAAFLLFAAVGEAVYRRTGQEALGLGDAKLFAAAGAWVSWQALPSVLLIASLGGLVYALAVRQSRGDSKIAFGPWIALGFFLTWVSDGFSTLSGCHIAEPSCLFFRAQ